MSSYQIISHIFNNNAFGSSSLSHVLFGVSLCLGDFDQQPQKRLQAPPPNLLLALVQGLAKMLSAIPRPESR